MSYTPGPWKWNDGYAGLIGSNGNPVLDHAPYEGMWLSHEGDREANARLIAAAPELVEALQEALRYVSPPLNEYDMSAEAMTHGKCRALLARIKGEA